MNGFPLWIIGCLKIVQETQSGLKRKKNKECYSSRNWRRSSQNVGQLKTSLFKSVNPQIRSFFFHARIDHQNISVDFPSKEPQENAIWWVVHLSRWIRRRNKGKQSPDEKAQTERRDLLLFITKESFHTKAFVRMKMTPSKDLLSTLYQVIINIYVTDIILNIKNILYPGILKTYLYNHLIVWTHIW